VHRRQFFYGLQLDYNQAVDKQIQSQSLVEENTIDLERDWLVALDDETALLELFGEYGCVDGLEETRPKTHVESDRRANEPVISSISCSIPLPSACEESNEERIRDATSRENGRRGRRDIAA
jgi:hypothetical protein